MPESTPSPSVMPSHGQQAHLPLGVPPQTPGDTPKRTVKNGAPSNDLVLSAALGTNEDIFPSVLSLYAAPGSTVADITYGRGVFWRNVPPDRYRLLATDLIGGVDSRALPYRDGEIDCVVFDPPYMYSPGGTAHRGHKPFERYYRNNGTGNRTGAKYHEAVLDFMLSAKTRSARTGNGSRMSKSCKHTRTWASSPKTCSCLCGATGPARAVSSSKSMPARITPTSSCSGSPAR